MSDRDTIERAIRHIDSCLDVDPWARDIAIDAMKAQLSGEDTTSDCISRQAALDAVYNIVRTDNWKAAVTMVIMDLPSAQSDLQPTCNQLATDTIYRQAAIDAVENCEPGEELFVIKSLPSAQPELTLKQIEEYCYKRCMSIVTNEFLRRLIHGYITDEQAIEHLQATGWMQNHDREMYESGLREQLADDSGSYDSLIPCEDTISRQAAIDEEDSK